MMKITVLGAHNIESRQTKNAGLLLDGVLALDAGGLTSSLTLEQQLKLKAVLLTHHHYDHIKDIPALGMSLFLNKAGIDIYCTAEVAEALKSHLLNGSLYPDFTAEVNGGATLKINIIEPDKKFGIENFGILPLPVIHSVPAVGYYIEAEDGTSLFYAGDTGPGLEQCWRRISPGLVITEVTASDKYEQFAREKRHLTPSLLRDEMLAFCKIKGYLPDVVAVHMNPMLEEDIRKELAAVAAGLGNKITPAHEGMQIEI